MITACKWSGILHDRFLLDAVVLTATTLYTRVAYSLTGHSMPATSMHVLLIVGTARMIKELASAVLSHVSGSCCFVLMRNGIIVDSSCFVLLTDSIVAGTLPRRILQRFR